MQQTNNTEVNFRFTIGRLQYYNVECVHEGLSQKNWGGITLIIDRLGDQLSWASYSRMITIEFEITLVKTEIISELTEFKFDYVDRF